MRRKPRRLRSRRRPPIRRLPRWDARLADLEKQVKTMKDKEAEAKKKAESQPTVTPFGMIQLDTAAFHQNDTSHGSNGDAINATKFRRVRLGVAGDLFPNMDYKVEMEFVSDTRPTMKDVYFTVKELPLIENVRVGHFKEPFGLEQQTSDKFITFMERSMADEGFIAPARNLGIMNFGWTESQRATWAIGGFVNEPQIEDPPQFPPTTAQVTNATADDRAQAALTMRTTYLPWYDEATEGRGLWHTGLGYSYRADKGFRNNSVAGDGTIEKDYSVRPEARFAPIILNTSALPADHNQLLGAETAFVYGPFSFQSEYFADFIENSTMGDITFTGYYAYFSYFLTGENRPYNRKAGCFDRVRPFTNFFRLHTCDGVESGWGAWEVGYRFSYVDMFDGIPANQRTVGLGRAADHTLGVNWYLNPYSRIMCNYILSDYDRVDVAQGALVKNNLLNTLELRAQFDF